MGLQVEIVTLDLPNSKHGYNHSNATFDDFIYNQNDQVKEDQMGRACSSNGGEEECM
jgi:hypothetical protein